ncbi:MAG TPA: hypothetical protein VF145_09690 [Chitinophagaceae bacterium]
MKQIFLLALAATFTYLGYLTISIYLQLNGGRIGFRLMEPMDWMLYTLLICCFGFAWHALTGLLPRRKSS